MMVFAIMHTEITAPEEITDPDEQADFAGALWATH